MKNLTYDERLRRYEQEKARLMMQPLTDREYMQKIKELADKWGI